MMKIISIVMLFLSGICLADTPVRSLVSIEIDSMHMQINGVKDLVDSLQNSMSGLNRSLAKLSNKPKLNQEDRQLILLTAELLQNTAKHIKIAVANLPDMTKKSTKHLIMSVQNLTNQLMYKIILLGVLLILGLGLLIYFTLKPIALLSNKTADSFNALAKSMDNIAIISQKNQSSS